MNTDIQRALETGKVIDITTTGRKSGQARRIEIWFHNLDGVIFISGRPGRRGWYANLVANPEFTFHLKRETQADLPARATSILDVERRREVFTRIRDQRANLDMDVDAWVEGSPLVEVEFLARKVSGVAG